MSVRSSCAAAFVAVLAAGASLSCSTTPAASGSAAVGDGKYDSEFPTFPPGETLDEIADAVKMLTCIAYYRVYPFDSTERIRRESVTAAALEARSARATYVNTTLAAATTVLQYQERRVLLLSCAHVLALPDTVIAYYVAREGREDSFIRSVSVKEKQTVFVAVFPEGGELEILAMDRSSDVALVGKRFTSDPPDRMTVFRFPFGSARELGWGTLVYVFGFPSGLKVLTTGLVASPNRDRAGSFLIDAASSKGFSGGPVLALRDGIPRFELVGIVRSIPGHVSYYLAPDTKDGTLAYEPDTPYEGIPFIERHTEIDYGVTQIVPVEAVRDLIESNRDKLRLKGYVLRSTESK